MLVLWARSQVGAAGLVLALGKAGVGVPMAPEGFRDGIGPGGRSAAPVTLQQFLPLAEKLRAKQELESLR